MTTRIVGLSGSWRKGSYNTALLNAAREVAPEGVTLEIASIKKIPLYDGDDDLAFGPPEMVADLKDRIASADGLLLASPEYNQSMPGVLKNAVDWLTRPPSDVRRVFGGRAVAVIGATPGAGGTRAAQLAWLPVLRALGVRPWTGSPIYVASAGKVFDQDGRLVDDATRDRLSRFMAAFSAFAAQGKHE